MYGVDIRHKECYHYILPGSRYVQQGRALKVFLILIDTWKNAISTANVHHEGILPFRAHIISGRQYLN